MLTRRSVEKVSKLMEQTPPPETPTRPAAPASCSAAFTPYDIVVFKGHKPTRAKMMVVKKISECGGVVFVSPAFGNKWVRSLEDQVLPERIERVPEMCPQNSTY